MHPEGCRVCSGAFGPFPSALVVVGFVQVRSVHSRAPCGSAVSYGCVRSIPVQSGSGRIRSGVFGPFPSALGVVVLVRVRSVVRQVSSGSIVCFPFSCAHGVVVLVRVRSAHSLASWGSFRYVRSIPVRHGDRRVHTGVLGPFLCCLGVRSVHSRAPCGSSNRSVVFGPLPCALGVVRFVRVRSIHSRTPWRLPGSFGSVRSIDVLPRVRPVRSEPGGTVDLTAVVAPDEAVAAQYYPACSFGPFQCTLGFVLVRSVDSRGPW